MRQHNGKSALIAFTGRAGCGKNEAYRALLKGTGTRWGGLHREYKFAQPLRNAVSAMFEYEDDEIEQYKEYRFERLAGKPTVRDFLKIIGASVRNQLHPDIWVSFLERELEQDTRCGIFKKDAAIITDLRYPNEAELVKKWGGLVIRIERQFNTDGSPFRPRSTGHESEVGISDELVDFTIQNEGITTPEFHADVQQEVGAYFKEIK